MRDTSFSICKALAIILVVISHAGAPGWINDFIFQFHVPVFFFCAGYFFKLGYLDTPGVYLGHRLTRLYWPFVKWSLFFLIVHNLLFPLGLLSETFGNATGGVLHPYTFADFCQRSWNVVFNMSGYDEFICGAFWFFRSLFIGSIGFLLGLKLFRKLRPEDSWIQSGLLLSLLVVLLIVWKIGMGLRITGIAGGGYRELMAVLFMTLGFLFSRYRPRMQMGWLTTAVCTLITVLGAIYYPTSMAFNADYGHFFMLLLTATAGFLLTYSLSCRIDRLGAFVRRPLVYIGDRTLHIFAFHLLAFKVVSAVKVAWYGLPWQAVGSHTVVNSHTDDAFWILYTLVGVALPLAWLAGYRYLAGRFDLSLKSCLRYALNFTIRALVLLVVGLRKLLKSLWHMVLGIRDAIYDIISASSPKDE